MNRMRKCNDEVYKLAKDQTLVNAVVRHFRQPYEKFGNKCVKILKFGRNELSYAQNKNRGTHWKTLADLKFISLTIIQVGKKIKDRKKRVFG
jgi:hypothetical protein